VDKVDKVAKERKKTKAATKEEGND